MNDPGHPKQTDIFEGAKKMDLTSQTPSGIDKTKRYGWIMKDEPGEQTMLPKELLHVHQSYQRPVVAQKVKEITAAWSWLSCGSLIVGKRRGQYWVIDGQHRALAAMRRSDITHLPCVVFETANIRQEARGFLDANTGRKPVSAISKQKALVCAGDEVAQFVQKTCAELGISIRPYATHARHLKCIGWCMKRAQENRAAFVTVLTMVGDLSEKDDIHMPERVLEGLWIIHAKCGTDGLHDKRLADRVRDKGVRVLLEAANRACAYYAGGGGKIWAEGILSELNKGLRNKFTFGGTEETGEITT